MRYSVIPKGLTLAQVESETREVTYTIQLTYPA